MDDGIARLQPDRLLQQGKRFVSVFRHRDCGERERAEKQIIGIQVFGPLAPRTLDFGLAQGRLDGADDAHGHLVL
jgi:hypothetical protein